jgi:hypothetical protein
VSVGMIGVMSEVELAVVPAYRPRARVLRPLRSREGGARRDA